MGLLCSPALRRALRVTCLGRSTEGGWTIAQGCDGTGIGCNTWDARFLSCTCCKKWSRTPSSSSRWGWWCFPKLSRPNTSQPLPAKEVTLQRWKRVRKFPSVGSISGCAETLRGEGRQSLVWPKMPKSVRARQRRSVSVTVLAQKYSPLVQCTEIKLLVEKELAQDLESLLWEGMGLEPEKQQANIHI